MWLTNFLNTKHTSLLVTLVSYDRKMNMKLAPGQMHRLLGQELRRSNGTTPVEKNTH
jgi:hypothetical protein